MFTFTCSGGGESEEQPTDGGTDYTLARHGTVAHPLDGRGGNRVPLSNKPWGNLPIQVKIQLTIFALFYFEEA